MRTLAICSLLMLPAAHGSVISLSAAASHDPVEVWAQSVISTDVGGITYSHSWDADEDTLRIPFTLSFPRLHLPAGATIQSVRGPSGKWPQWNDPRIPQTKTVSAEPIRTDCWGSPCPFFPTIEFGLALITYTEFDETPPTVAELESGYVMGGLWHLTFSELTEWSARWGFNSVTVNRWEATYSPSITVTWDVDYSASAVPEPGTAWLCAGTAALVFIARRR